MKVIFRLILLVLVMFGLIYGYLWWMRYQADQRSNRVKNTELVQDQSLFNQDREASFEGTLMIADNKYYLQLFDKSTIDLANSQIMLNSFLNKKVIVSGKLKDGKIIVSKVQEI